MTLQKNEFRPRFHFNDPLVKDTAINNKPSIFQAAKNFKDYLKKHGEKNDRV